MRYTSADEIQKQNINQKISGGCKGHIVTGFVFSKKKLEMEKKYQVSSKWKGVYGI